MKKLGSLIGVLLILAVIIAIISWVFKNIVGLIGVSIAIWGVYKWLNNRKRGKQSKLPAILLLIGLLISFGWFSTKSGDTAEKAPSAKEKAVQVENKDTAKSTPSSSNKEESKTEQKSDITEDKQTNSNSTVVPVNTNKKNSRHSTNRVLVTLTETVDGDTIKVMYKGKRNLFAIS